MAATNSKRARAQGTAGRCSWRHCGKAQRRTAQRASPRAMCCGAVGRAVCPPESCDARGRSLQPNARVQAVNQCEGQRELPRPQLQKHLPLPGGMATSASACVCVCARSDRAARGHPHKRRGMTDAHHACPGKATDAIFVCTQFPLFSFFVLDLTWLIPACCLCLNQD
jgi:hypothetical protein